MLPGTLRLLISLDKGSCSTKLMLQVLNFSKRHSVHSGRLLGFFRDQDTYGNIKTAFSKGLSKFMTQHQMFRACTFQPLPSNNHSPFNNHSSSSTTTPVATSTKSPKVMQQLAKLRITPTLSNCANTATKSCTLCLQHPSQHQLHAQPAQHAEAISC